MSTGMKQIFLDPIGRQRTCVGSGTPRARGGPTDEVLGFRPDFIEHQLAHAVRDPNDRTDDRMAFLRTTTSAAIDQLYNTVANRLTMDQSDSFPLLNPSF